MVQLAEHRTTSELSQVPPLCGPFIHDWPPGFSTTSVQVVSAFDIVPPRPRLATIGLPLFDLLAQLGFPAVNVEVGFVAQVGFEKLVGHSVKGWSKPVQPRGNQRRIFCETAVWPARCLLCGLLLVKIR